MKCPKCGCALPEDSEFCQYCGINIAEEERAQAALAAAARSTKETCDADYMGIVKEDAPVEREPEPLFMQAYNSYISTTPAGQQLFNALIGGDALKTAYLEECEKQAKLNEAGIRVDYKDSYLEFMSILRKEYSNPNDAIHQNTKVASAVLPSSTHHYAPQTQPTGKKLRHCKHCGQVIDPNTKRCVSCGKRHSKLTTVFITLVILLITAVAIVGVYAGINYHTAVTAMHEQKFIKAQQHFNNLFIGDKLFPEQAEYIRAGVLYEQGEYVNAYHAFMELTDIPVPVSITESLKSDIYTAGQQAYRQGDSVNAKRCFLTLDGYKDSATYLTLIECGSPSYFASWAEINKRYQKLVKLIGFEDADQIIIKNGEMMDLFLTGRWEDGTSDPYYFEMFEDDDGNLSCRYNLPNKDVDGYYFLNDGVYSVGEDEATAVKCFKFSITSEDSIAVYCYKDGSTQRLYRQ